MTERNPGHPIDPIFLERWSPRAFDAQTMPEADLLTLIEAARWAPSAYNYQPWRFLYARRDDAHWQGFLNLLVPFNMGWAQHASALIFVLSDRLMGGSDPSELSPSHSHSFDAGAAWAQLALQAVRLGYHARGMAGVDFDRAREHLNVPERFRIEIAIAVGRRADPARLPDALQKHEHPTQRRPVHEIAFAGAFPG
jgi:nitroreductase